jgi:flagellar biosynthesis chaperone FliJ
LSNKLFQLAKEAVHKAEQQLQNASTEEDIDDAIQYVETAKNNLSSAFANSTTAERQQLQQYQQQLDEVVQQQTHE